MPTISPELVLVDPELARYARARLPDTPYSNGRVTRPRVETTAAPAHRSVVGAGSVARAAPEALPLALTRLRQAALTEIEAEPAPARSHARRLLLTAAGLGVFVVGLVVPSFFAGSEPVLGDARPTTVGGATAGIGDAVSGAQVVTASIPTAPPPAATRAAAPADRYRRPGRATKDPVPTHLFVWLPQRGAHFYRVRFLRGTRTVYEAWPTAPRVTVPMRGTFHGRMFAFTNGRYRWIVQPGYGPRSRPRYVAPIVRSVWVVGSNRSQTSRRSR